MPYKILLIGKDNTLPAVKKEINNIYNICKHRQNIEVEKVSKNEDLVDEKLANNIDYKILHYAGHVKKKTDKNNQEKRVVTVGEEDGNLKGLAILCSFQEDMRLVFMNACSTDDAIDDFFKNGVKAVIATNRAVDDKDASRFAKRFYNQLVQGKNIEAAYKFAAGGNIYDSDVVIHKEPIEIRGLKLKPKDKGVAWGLFFAKEHQDVLDWRPFERPPVKPKQWKYLLAALVALALVGMIYFVVLDRIEQQKWKQTTDKNTIEAYEFFFNQYPDSEYRVEGIVAIQELTWLETKKANSVAAYTDFLKKYPDSKYKIEAEANIEELAWEKAREVNTVDAYRNFLEKYPNSRYKREAEEAIKELQPPRIITENPKSPIIKTTEKESEIKPPKKYTIYGSIVEKTGGEELESVLVLINGKEVAQTDEIGRFSAIIDSVGIANIEFVKKGYETRYIQKILPRGTGNDLGILNEKLTKKNDEE